MEKAVIGFFGGTFDPPHLGHVDLAKKTLDHYRFEKLFFVPARQNPHKNTGPCASNEQRREMLARAIAETGESRFEILDWEIERTGPSYTIDTLIELRSRYSNSAELAVLVGDEVFSALPQWKEPKRLLALANWVVVTRTGSTVDIEAVVQAIGYAPGQISGGARREIPETSRWVDIFPLSALPFNSTALRAEMKNGHVPQGIQRSVWLYIKENALYSVK